MLRDGKPVDVPIQDVVPGDCILLRAGMLIPGNCRLLEAKDLFVDEASLTGESFPVEKAPGIVPEQTPLSKRTNMLFLDTHIISGTARAVVMQIGTETEFGRLAKRLDIRPPETEFEPGIRRFGAFLLEIVLLLSLVIFAINVYFARPVLDSFLFALALTVGLVPQLLPAIISVSLAQGAKRMARSQVIVKRLEAIENFGSMNVFCTDKTGTLTQGNMQLHAALDIEGHESAKVFDYAYLNASYETGFANPLDAATRSYRSAPITGWSKLDEIPYDFLSKRLSILVERAGTRVMITKGALASLLDTCMTAQLPEQEAIELVAARDCILERATALGEQGLRVLGVAYRTVQTATITHTSEAGMTFLGFLAFTDPPKEDIEGILHDIRQLGITLKIITGDNRAVAGAIARQVGFSGATMLTGSEIAVMSDAALRRRVNDVAIFAEIEPNQKERIVMALNWAGNVVGYMGDGINDVAALHAADVGISVEGAVDVAKEAAPIVLLKQDLGVLVLGIREGRKTFVNTVKYVFNTISGNFGNMLTMAGISLVLPFLPQLATQILLTSFLTDIPSMMIATDTVDRAWVERPRRWNLASIRAVMLVFGLVSALFYMLIYAMLVYGFQASAAQFRTGWFLATCMTQLTLTLVVRTQQPILRSHPSTPLLVAVLICAAVALALPFTPLGLFLEFTPVSLTLLAALGGVTVLYLLVAELTKYIFYRHVSF